MSLTHWKANTNPLYIGAYSLQPKEERTVEIVEVKKEVITGDGGKKDTKNVAYLKDEKPFIINATNAKRLTALFGSPYIETWAGKRFTVYAETIKDKKTGEEMDALRVKTSIPSLPELNPDSPKWDEALRALIDGKTTIEKIEKKYCLSTESRQLLKEAHL